MRIVSLLPSATEILCELGFADKLVGVSHQCDYPESIRGLPKVTCSRIPNELSSQQIDQMVREECSAKKSLFSLRTNVLSELAPDLIVTQSLCDVCAVAESEVAKSLSQMASRPQVLDLAPRNLDELFDSILQVGHATDAIVQARASVEHLQGRVERIARRFIDSGSLRPKAVVLEWLDPLFSAGHWNPELIALAGGMECVGRSGNKSTSISWLQLLDANPDVLIIACCGYNLSRAIGDLPSLVRRPGIEELRAVRNRRVYVADGNAYFNRPGPRLIDTLEIIAHCLHPTLFPLPDHLQSGLLKLEQINRL